VIFWIEQVVVVLDTPALGCAVAGGFVLAVTAGAELFVFAAVVGLLDTVACVAIGGRGVVAAVTGWLDAAVVTVKPLGIILFWVSQSVAIW
jgi:hypothetical protein